jgi:hypothetical protein
MGSLQLSVVIPQRDAHQVACAWHSQTFCEVHACPAGQTELQLRV